MKSYVLIGGPGVGKTTVLELLASRGYAITSETARMIIEEETRKESDVLPWKNLAKFQEVVAQKQFQIEKSSQAKVRFLDRSIKEA